MKKSLLEEKQPLSSVSLGYLLRERISRIWLFCCASVSVVTTAAIVVILCAESLAFFKQVSIFEFLTHHEWTPLFSDPHFGIAPLLAGTLLTTFIAVSFAVPAGLLIAIYLSEFANVRVRGYLKPLLELLAGIPTVVYGYFALTMVSPALQKIMPSLAGFNGLSAGLVMGMMILPTIASLCEDALFAVPSTMREGAYALGGTRLSSIFKVVVPAAFSGIAASMILGISRAMGETMIVAIAAGQQPRLTFNPGVPIETMTAYIVQVSLGDTPTGTLEYRTVFVVALSLFMMTLLLNLVAHRLRRRMAHLG